MLSTYSGREVHVITLREEKILKVLESSIEISKFDPSQKDVSREVRFKTTAIWDTGASSSVITQEVVSALSL